MKLVVTGGAGFIGSNFVRQVVAGSYPDLVEAQVTVLDALTYAGHLSSLDSVGSAIDFVHGDITDPHVVESVLTDADVVVHFAAESHVDRSIISAEPFIRANVVGTQVLLDAVLRSGVRRFLHVSTDEVYGSVPAGRSTEESLLAPNSPYAASKAASDLLVRAYVKTHEMDAVITRCTNNYGPYQLPEKVIPLFITNLLRGKSVPLYGDGANIREWLHVDDHCRALAMILQSGVPGGIYNIGGGTDLTNSELTQRILTELCSDWSTVEYVPDRLGHDRRYALDSTKLQTDLGFAPAVDFAGGLHDTVEWYRNHRDWWEPLLVAS